MISGINLRIILDGRWLAKSLDCIGFQGYLCPVARYCPVKESNITTPFILYLK